MNSLIASIQAAIRPGAGTYSPDEGGITGASAPNSEAPPSGASNGESDMTLPNNPTGASAGVADLSAAVATAQTGGLADGFKAASDRLNAVMGAEGIKGDGKRMAAALDLASQSPDMSAEAVVAFVSANVSATAPAGQPASATYEEKRLSAAALAAPAVDTSKAAGSGLSRAVSAHIETLKRTA